MKHIAIRSALLLAVSFGAQSFATDPVPAAVSTTPARRHRPAPVVHSAPEPSHRVVEAPKPDPVEILSVANDPSRPDATVHQINQTAKDIIIDGAINAQTSAGASSPSKNPKGPVMPPPPAAGWTSSAGVDYSYINSDDERAKGADGDTHSASANYTLISPDGLMLGLVYVYSNTDLSAPEYGTNSDAHFISLFAGKQLTPWLTAGVSAGYGNTDTNVSSRDVRVGSDLDTWNASPFLAATYVNGSFFAATSVAYQFADTDGLQTHSLILEQSAGYMLTEKLTAAALVRYHNQLDRDGFDNADDDWLTLGGRLGYQVTNNCRAYAAYEYDSLNDTYENHTVKGGVSVTF